MHFLCPTSINTNLTLKSFPVVIRLRIFAVKFSDRGISKISKTELLMTIFNVVKLFN